MPETGGNDGERDGLTVRDGVGIHPLPFPLVVSTAIRGVRIVWTFDFMNQSSSQMVVPIVEVYVEITW